MQIPIRRQLQRLAFLRRLAKGGAVSPAFRWKATFSMGMVAS